MTCFKIYEESNCQNMLFTSFLNLFSLSVRVFLGRRPGFEVFVYSRVRVLKFQVMLVEII